jgi:3-methyl-2-oxobutanoate hydroxymethyltransferase
MNIFDFQRLKQSGKKISIITCYDYWSARIIAETSIDCVLVGDSLAMVMHGHATPIPASVELMALHTQAVAKGVANKFIITDMPFLAHRKGLTATMNAVEQLMQAGAHAIKIEGGEDNFETIKHIVTSGVPVMGHIGMTAQSFHQLGGFRVQGKHEKAAEQLLEQAIELEKAGCFALVLECMPPAVAKAISNCLGIATIGIGAGSEVDGQVLVFHDLLGMIPDFKPKFLKKYLHGFTLMQEALNAYDEEVKKQEFPLAEHCY